MTVEKTYVIKGEPESEWLLVDANGQSMGVLATQIASYLLGNINRHIPRCKDGDFVVVSMLIICNSQKKLATKHYYRIPVIRRLTDKH
jgi:large subunit ribosomal protein L13